LSQQWLGNAVRKGTRNKKARRRGPFTLPGIEQLEDRTLMTTTPSVLPAAVVAEGSQRPIIGGTASTPTIVADPLDPTHLIMAAVTGNTISTGNSGVTIAFSLNSGRDWTTFGANPAERLWHNTTGFTPPNDTPGPNPTFFPGMDFTQANSPS